jgi:chromosome segregation ATPase
MSDVKSIRQDIVDNETSGPSEVYKAGFFKSKSLFYSWVIPLLAGIAVMLLAVMLFLLLSGRKKHTQVFDENPLTGQIGSLESLVSLQKEEINSLKAQVLAFNDQHNIQEKKIEDLNTRLKNVDKVTDSIAVSERKAAGLPAENPDIEKLTSAVAQLEGKIGAINKTICALDERIVQKPSPEADLKEIKLLASKVDELSRKMSSKSKPSASNSNLKEIKQCRSAILQLHSRLQTLEKKVQALSRGKNQQLNRKQKNNKDVVKKLFPF